MCNDVAVLDPSDQGAWQAQVDAWSLGPRAGVLPLQAPIRAGATNMRPG